MTNKKSKFAIAISATVVAGALALGAVASAAGSGSDTSGIPSTSGRQHLTGHLTAQQKCDKAPQVDARVTTLKQRIEQRLATLRANKAKADSAGNTVRSQRIQHRIDRLTKVETRVDTRYAKFETWVQANCGGNPVTPGSGTTGA
jgi:hypothetical protein